jgi:hypothetical protein
MLAPVVLSPGWASEATRFSATRSFEIATMGMVFVARCTARIRTGEAVKMTSAPALTAAAATPSARSPVTPQSSIERLLPSMDPARRNSSNRL